jgi:O-antigen/teichoic acid export membrane protein
VLGARAELTRGRLLARNVGLNAAGWALPAACAVFAIPALVRAMGAERFGILAIAWALVGSFSPFDLGIGRALTQALSERVGRADQGDSPDVTWGALWLLAAVGTLGAVALALAAPALAGRWLRVSPGVEAEAARALRLLALAVPLTALTSGLRGVLEAGQAFRAVNALRVPLALLTFVGPWAVQPLSHGLPAAVLVLVGARALVCGLHAYVVVGLYPALRRPRPPRASALRSLWRVAGWMTVSTLSNPILVTGDRFLIGAALPVAAVAQYAAVSEVASKLGLVAAVLQPVLFPALAATLAADPRRAAALFDRGVRATVLALAPAALAVVAFAPEGLRAWLGPEFARGAAPVLQLLAVAAYVNTCAQMPFSALQSAGRPDIPAKLHTLEVPLYLGALWFLVGRFGLVGAAVAWLLRMLVDTLALYAAVPLAVPGGADAMRATVRRAGGLTLGGAAALALCALARPLPARVALAVLGGGALVVGARRWLVTSDERALLTRAWPLRRGAAPRGAEPAGAGAAPGG